MINFPAKRSGYAFMACLVLPLAASMALSGTSPKTYSPIRTMLTSVEDGNGQTLESTEMVFTRSQEVHRNSMETIAKSMTQSKAIKVIEKSTLVSTPTLKQITGLLGVAAQESKNLRKHLQGHDGFGGLNGARLLLNDMIHEVMLKYDAEIAKCTSYYAAQCALMEVARGQISAANFVAATARALILDAQQNINHCELSIPETQLELKEHNAKCKEELGKLTAKLKIILFDIEIITYILEMSDCDSKGFLQMKNMSLQKCTNECTNRTYVSFNNKGLQDRVNKLRSPGAQDLMRDTFANMFDGDSDSDEDDAEPIHLAIEPKIPQKTKFNNPPVPRTEIPAKPALPPVPSMKRCGDKCHLKDTGARCYEIAAKFLKIQSEIADSRDELLDVLSKAQAGCDETKKTLEMSINNDGILLAASQTKMGTAMEKEASAGETGRQVAKENQQYNDDLVKQMKLCSTNYVDFETEMCALKKIRGDLFKKMKPGHPGFFQDCEVSPWTPETCTKKVRRG